MGTPPAHERRPPPDPIHSVRTIEKGHGRIETRQFAVNRERVAYRGGPGAAQRRIENLHLKRGVTLREDLSPIRSGTSPRALAAMRNTLLNVDRDAAEPLTEIREIFAESRCDAIAAAQRGLL